MQFIADESCAGPVIRALRTAGHDVIAIAEISRGIPDESVMEHAFAERRVLITEDSDFGELVYVKKRPSAGVVLVKFHRRMRKTKPAAVVDAIAKLGERLRDGFAVVEPGRVRLAKRPST